MLGTILKNGNSEKFIQGVYNFPTLDNPVWYVTEKDLQHIFDDKIDKEKLEFEKDFYLPVGTSPAFSDRRTCSRHEARRLPPASRFSPAAPARSG